MEADIILSDGSKVFKEGDFYFLQEPVGVLNIPDLVELDILTQKEFEEELEKRSRQ